MKSLRALLALSLLLAAGQAAAWPAVPLPEHSQGEWVTRHMNYNGLDMRASRFVTAQGLDQVRQFYKGLWGDQHVENDILGKTVLGRAEGTHFITVELKPLGGGTEGMIGVLEMVEGKVDFTIGEGFATPEGSEIYNDIRYLDGPKPVRVLGLNNGHSPFVNQQFYHRQLKMQGWRALSDPNACRSAATACIASFERRDQTMTLVISRGAAGASQVVATIE